MFKILNLLSIIFCCTCAVSTFFIDYSNQHLVPTHFSVLGEPDSWGSPYICIIIALIAIALYLVISYLCKHPEKMNYPFKVSAKFRNENMRIGIGLVVIIRFLVLLLLTNFNITIAFCPEQHYTTIGLFMPIVTLCILTTICISIYLFYKVWRKDKKQ